MIQVVHAATNEIFISRKEIYRYLGYGNTAVAPAVKTMAETCLAELESSLSCRACYDRFPVHAEANEMDFLFTKVSSRSLRKNLKACHEIIVFTATIGFGIDRIIQKYSSLSPANAVVAQAIGTAAIEAWCNLLCQRFAEQEALKGNYLRPRFSPGYGDLPLEMQKHIFRVLDCPRKIGVSLNESLLMSPSKSVSALIGISKQNSNCLASGCEACKNTECEFRRSNG